MAQVRLVQVGATGVQIGSIGRTLLNQGAAAVQLGAFNNQTGTFYKDPTNPATSVSARPAGALRSRTLGYITGTGALTATAVAAGTNYISIWNNATAQGTTGLQLTTSSGNQQHPASSQVANPANPANPFNPANPASPGQTAQAGQPGQPGQGANPATYTYIAGYTITHQSPRFVPPDPPIETVYISQSGVGQQAYNGYYTQDVGGNDNDVNWYCEFRANGPAQGGNPFNPFNPTNPSNPAQPGQTAQTAQTAQTLQQVPAANQPAQTTYNGSITNSGTLRNTAGFAVSVTNIGTLTTIGGTFQGTGAGGVTQKADGTKYSPVQASITMQQGIWANQGSTVN
jgi:hypothetical protein